MSLTPEIIRERTVKGDISRDVALDLLFTLIDHSEDDSLRLESLFTLQKLQLKNKHIYHLLENLLISDENEEIRSFAGEILILSFSEVELEPIMWALENESSYTCLSSLIESLGKSENYNHHKVLLSFIMNLLHRSLKKRARRV